MAPSVTQPPPPSLAAGHTHTRFSGKGPRRARTSKFPFPHPTAFPRRPRGPAGAKELIPARSLPPSTPARLPAFPVRARELRPSPSRSRRTRGPGPAGGHHYMQVIGGERAPNGGSAYSCRGPVPQLQVDPPLHVHVSLFPPSSNLTFRGGGGGGRGVPACAARAVGRGLLAVEPGGAVPGGGRRAGWRTEPPEPSYSRERRETMEGKGGWSAAQVSLPPPPAAAPHCA